MCSNPPRLIVGSDWPMHFAPEGTTTWNAHQGLWLYYLVPGAAPT